MQNTHARKAENYNIGRPDYPQEFFDWLYDAFSPEAIADIGCGPGKITQGFAQRGSQVYAVEPDPDMFAIAEDRLSQFENCRLLGNTAEHTGIPSASIDLIFCGNSYMWFDRAKTIPEFRRILKPGGDANVLLATLYSLPGEPQQQPPFQDGMFAAREFVYTVHQDWNTFRSGMLSVSSSPNPDDACFDDYCTAVKQRFDKHSINEKLPTQFLLTCKIGSVNDLI